MLHEAGQPLHHKCPSSLPPLRLSPPLPGARDEALLRPLLAKPSTLLLPRTFASRLAEVSRLCLPQPSGARGGAVLLFLPAKLIVLLIGVGSLLVLGRHLLPLKVPARPPLALLLHGRIGSAGLIRLLHGNIKGG